MPTNPADRLAQIEARAEKATDGPWLAGAWGGQCHKPEHAGRHPGLQGDNPCVYDPEFHQTDGDAYTGIVGPTPDVQVVWSEYEELKIRPDDAEFIAHAREDIPWLLAELRTLQQQLEQREHKINELIKCDSFMCPYEKRMREAEAQLATLQQQRDLYENAQCITCSKDLAALSAEREPEKPATLPSKS